MWTFQSGGFLYVHYSLTQNSAISNIKIHLKKGISISGVDIYEKCKHWETLEKWNNIAYITKKAF